MTGFTTDTTHSTTVTEAYETGRTHQLTIGTTTHPDRPGIAVQIDIGDRHVWLPAHQAFDIANAITEAATDAGWHLLQQQADAEAVDQLRQP